MDGETIKEKMYELYPNHLIYEYREGGKLDLAYGIIILENYVDNIYVRCSFPGNDLLYGKKRNYQDFYKALDQAEKILTNTLKMKREHHIKMLEKRKRHNYHTISALRRVTRALYELNERYE